MILYTLRCAADHEFEAWFRNGATYEAQAAAGEMQELPTEAAPPVPPPAEETK